MVGIVVLGPRLEILKGTLYPVGRVTLLRTDVHSETHIGVEKREHLGVLIVAYDRPTPSQDPNWRRAATMSTLSEKVRYTVPGRSGQNSHRHLVPETCPTVLRHRGEWPPLCATCDRGEDVLNDLACKRMSDELQILRRRCWRFRSYMCLETTLVNQQTLPRVTGKTCHQISFKESRYHPSQGCVQLMMPFESSKSLCARTQGCGALAEYRHRVC